MSEKLAQENAEQEELSINSNKVSEENREQKIPAVEENSEQEDPPVKKILELFDKALINNIERLMETNQGIDELPINICTFSCISLIAARETEIESFPYLPPERYTEEKIIEELAEIGIEPGEELTAAIESMIDKEYIVVADDGRFFAKPPTISMSKLIDRIFPKMPGLNLFAYLGQMLDEVMAERKDIRHAIDQFEQIMKIYGVPINSALPENKSKAKLYPHLRVPSTPASTKKNKDIPLTDTKPSDIYSQLQTKTLKTPLRSEDPYLEKDKPRNDKPSGEQEETPVSEKLTAIEKVDSGDEKEIKEHKISISPTGEDYEKKADISADRSFEEHESKGETFEEDDSPGLDIKDAVEQLEDDDIEKRIAAFEEQLAMTCPICHTPSIKSQVTTKGKTYYSCSNKECNFISWGKPYYITCPRCNNPFLVEATGNEGTSMLKCPKATCPHWQKFPWEEELEPTKEDQEPALEDKKKPKKRRRAIKRRRVVRRRK